MTKAEKVLEALHGKSIATAESCTGGLIGGAITSVKGASSVFKGGIICYQNEIKQRLLGVDEKVLAKFGAVSAPVAMDMAAGARKALMADIAVSVGFPDQSYYCKIFKRIVGVSPGKFRARPGVEAEESE